MAYGVSTVFTVTIASGVSTSAEVDMGRSYARVFIDPTGAAGSVMFQAAPCALGAAGTYRLVRYPVLSGMSVPQTATVGSAMSGSLVEVPPLAGFRFVKVLADATIANGATLKLVCSDL